MAGMQDFDVGGYTFSLPEFATEAEVGRRGPFATLDAVVGNGVWCSYFVGAGLGTPDEASDWVQGALEAEGVEEYAEISAVVQGVAFEGAQAAAPGYEQPVTMFALTTIAGRDGKADLVGVMVHTVGEHESHEALVDLCLRAAAVAVIRRSLPG